MYVCSLCIYEFVPLWLWECGSVYACLYVYMCVCVCVCACVRIVHIKNSENIINIKDFLNSLIKEYFK